MALIFSNIDDLENISVRAVLSALIIFSYNCALSTVEITIVLLWLIVGVWCLFLVGPSSVKDCSDVKMTSVNSEHTRLILLPQGSIY